MTKRVQVKDATMYRWIEEGHAGTVVAEWRIDTAAHIIKVELDRLNYALWFRPKELESLEEEDD